MGVRTPSGRKTEDYGPLVLRFTCPAIANVGHRPQGWVAVTRGHTQAHDRALRVGMRIAHGHVLKRGW